MKELLYLFCALACMAGANAQTVGVGTNVPDSNAVLDIFSTTKGVLLPRIIDTGTVPKPLEGLIIYNKATKSPYYYNGTRWLSLGGRLPDGMSSTSDEMTYQVTGSGFSTTEMEMLSFSHGASNPTIIGGGGLVPSGQSSLSAFSIMKLMDVNSKSFNLATLVGTKFASIEFKLYAAGATIPYASYRYKNVIFESYQTSGSAGGGGVFIESISVQFENYGFKDWVNNQEFGYNLISRSITAY